MMTQHTDRYHSYQEFPWLIFKLNEVLYAINSRYVMTILKKPDDIAPSIESPEYIRGIMNIRGEIIPLVTTSTLFHLPSKLEAVNEFKALINKVKKEHQLMMDQMELSVKTKKQFKISFDFSEMSLVQWYQTYQTENKALQVHLAQLEEPLRLLHEAALSMIECSRQCNFCARPKCQFSRLKTALEEHAPNIIKLLEDAILLVEKQGSEMVIVLSHDEYAIGYSMDAVVSVESLRIVSTAQTTKSLEGSHYIYGVGSRQTDQSDAIILLIDDVALLEIASFVRVESQVVEA